MGGVHRLQRRDVSISDEILNRTADAYRRLRNTARFLLANLVDFDPAVHSVPPQDMVALDRWLLRRAVALDAEVRDAYTAFQFHEISQKVHHFCAVDLGAFYLDVIKDRQYTCRADSLARRSAQTAMYHVLEALVRWLAPILSFTAEDIWQHLPGAREDSVLLAEWYALPALPDEADEARLARPTGSACAPSAMRSTANSNACAWRARSAPRWTPRSTFMSTPTTGRCSTSWATSCVLR